MLKILPNGSNRLDLELSGKLDAVQMEVALDEFSNLSAGFENATLLYEIADFQMPTLSALGVEFSRLPALLGVMRRFRKVAVLTDTTWLKKVSEWEGALYPGLEIKSFGRAERAAAEAWLAAP